MRQWSANEEASRIRLTNKQQISRQINIQACRQMLNDTRKQLASYRRLSRLSKDRYMINSGSCYDKLVIQKKRELKNLCEWLHLALYGVERTE